VYNRRDQRALFFKNKQKKESDEKASPRSWRPSVAGCQKKQKTVPSPEEKEKKKDQGGGRLYVERCKKDECTTRWW